jgi:hypothetical protein
MAVAITSQLIVWMTQTDTEERVFIKPCTADFEPDTAQAVC